MDPFIRNYGKGQISTLQNVGGGDGLSERSTSSVGSNKGVRSKSSKGSQPSKKKITQNLVKHPINIRDRTLTSQKSILKIPVTRTPSKASSSSSVHTLDVELIKPAVEIKSSQSIQYKKMGIKPWTVNDCGGKDGSQGVYRLVNQTTKEAIAEGRNDILPQQPKLEDADFHVVTGMLNSFNYAFLLFIFSWAERTILECFRKSSHQRR